jgi:membrane-bound lytic murein transglycosylase D
MIKKYLITCSVIWVTVVISVLFVYGKTDTKKVVKHTTEYKFIYPKNYLKNDFSFADEGVPVNDLRITRMMRHSLVRTSYNTLQSYVLQEEAVKIFPIVVPILKAYGIPEDFKYLPLVEAGLKSGVSKRGAAGWWQFMPGTARTYGLKVQDGRDDRYSVRRSTIAACKYLKELYAEFNSWTLAAAAYNIGEIKMAKAIKAQRQANYFRMHFNPETGSYMYRIIAMKQVIEQPELYGYKIKKPTYIVTLPPTDLMAFNN